MKNFDLKKFLVENQMTTNSKMLNENTTIEYKMMIPPHMVEYMLSEDDTLTPEQIDNIFSNYIISLIEENPFDEYLEDTDSTLQDLGSEIY